MIQLNVNGKLHLADVAADTPLLWVLRDTLGLTGTKYGCGQSLCGACVVHVDGKSAKACTLLAYTGIGAGQLECLVDKSTFKQGWYFPGNHLPIRSPDWLLEVQPEYTLILPWNFADEIIAQQAEYRRRGGKFIIPVPEPIVV